MLLVDTDPQASLTVSLGNPCPDDLSPTLSDLMGKIMMENPITPDEGILHHPEGVDLVPSNIELSGMEVALVNAMSRETILRQYLDTVKQNYDYILLDCMPSLGMLTVNALAAADNVLIPVQAAYLPAKGLEQLLGTINKVKRQINPKLRIEGILLTMVDSRTNYSKDISNLIRESYGGKLKVYKTDIPRSVRAEEISAEGTSIFKHDPKGKVAEAYKILTKEVLNNAEKGANISLKGYDDIFSTDQSRAEAQQERVQEIPLSELHPFEGHPFRVVDDEEMMKTAESVRDFGVLTPAIVRPDPDGGYEIVSGHRRHRASELAGKETMPAIVRDLDDDAAIILMVDANLQRESILPSERAFAYKMKLDAIKHQGQRTDLTSSQVGMKLQAMDIVGQEAGESRNQVHRYIRLTELIPELLDMVDTGQIKFNPAVELSYLASEEQKDFLSAMDYAQAAPSLSQAQRIKKLAQEGECTLDAMCEIMNEIKKGELDRVTFKTDSLRKYFPKSYTNKQMEDKIIQLLEQWQKKEKNQWKGKVKMFTPKNIQGALEELYDLCDPDYMVDMLVNYSEEFDDISPALLAKSFQKNAEMISEYRVLSSAGEGIDYQGKVLLNSRAVRLLSYVEDMSGDEKVRTIQSKELWLAEDMTFYVVSCMSTITMDKEEAICLNEHRSVVTTVECEDDIFFDMGSLICELDDICLFELLADVDATIYEL